MSLRAEGLCKNFGECLALSEVNVEFSAGKIHAVLGENGAGKSTLMKLLFGLLTPSAGKILLNGKEARWRNSLDAIAHGLGMVQQHFALVGPLSVIDNIMLGAEVSLWGKLDRTKAIARLENILPSRALQLPWYAKVDSLTVGQKQRVEVLKLLFRDSRILFLDEPTAVLTPLEISEFFEILRKLKNDGRTIVLITHKIIEVQQVCDTYTVLRQGRNIAHGQVAEVSAEELVEAMIGRKLSAFTFARAPTRPEKVLETVQLSGQILNAVSLSVHAGEIVGIAGVEGSGQSELVDMLMGLESFAGLIKIHGETICPLQPARVRAVGTGLVPEDRHSQGLWLEESCFMNMAIGLEDQFLSHQIFQDRKLRETTGRWAQEFDVRALSLAAQVSTLSGGNQQKVIFAREVGGRKPRFLICHQPTRGVDLGAIDLIHRKLMELRAQGLGVLLLSSELDELIKLCDRIYVMYNGKASAEFARANFERLAIGAAMTGVVHGR